MVLYMTHMTQQNSLNSCFNFSGLLMNFCWFCFQYILVVMALDSNDQEVDPPMEIQVLVEDENDNPPVCAEVESVFELQENEPAGKK